MGVDYADSGCSQVALIIFLSHNAKTNQLALFPKECLNGGTMSPDQAVKHFGSQKEIAEICGVSAAAVSLWVQWGKIPCARQYQLHVLSAGRLKLDRFEDKVKA